MGPADEINILLFQEISDHVWTENEAHSSLILIPALHPFLRVRPEQVA